MSSFVESCGSLQLDDGECRRLFICGQGSYFVAYVLVPGGAPPEAFAHMGSAISATLYAVGLILLASRVPRTVS